jgi:ubiquinone/menaquinone biosynthesis C-methylase UbiE
VRLDNSDNSWTRKKRAMEHYNSTVHLYTQQYDNEQAKKYSVALDEVKISKKEYVVDVGCGTGLFIKEVAEMAELIIGIDISRKMIEVAKKTCRNLKKIHLIYGDADYIPLKTKTIDKIFSFTVLQNMPEIHQIMREIRRISKADSKILLTFNKKAFSRKEVKKLLTKLKVGITCFIDYEDLKDYLTISVMD